ncbi:hypothetical protein DV735_g1057, partial [Chaetothyriales sp. CBS 134920]
MSFLDQARPPKPTLTEANLPSQAGRVYIVTGGYAGVGYHLSHILYGKGAKVYVAGRSKDKASQAISKIRKDFPASTGGELVFLQVDFSDLATVAKAAKAFQQQEQRLHVLWNNAGISVPPAGSKSVQGYDLQLAVHSIGPFLFSKLLLPQLRAAAAESPAASVRTVWVASYLVDAQAPKGGISLDLLNNLPKDPQKCYAISKLGSWFLASEFNRRESSSSGIVSVAVNPGNLKTDIWQNTGKVIQLLVSPILHDAKFGAYSELWAGLSPEVTKERGGGYVIPWGRWHPSPREDLLNAIKPEASGGSGRAQQFYDWCDSKTASFA